MTVRAALPEDVAAELAAELEALEAAEGTADVSTDYLRWSGRVARALARARAAIGARSHAPSSGDRRLSLEEAAFDGAILLRLLQNVEEASRGEGRDEYLRSLAEAAERDPELLTGLVAAATLGDDARPLHEAAERLQLPVHALVLLARLLATPFLVEARRRQGHRTELDARPLVTEDAPDKSAAAKAGHCPSCGSAAGLAVLRAEDGARQLVCLLCGDRWLAPRLMCASCGTRDQARLGVLSVAENDPRWVEACHVCRRYLKTVDSRRLPDGGRLVPRAEDARTLYLDMIAEADGYVRPAW